MTGEISIVLVIGFRYKFVDTIQIKRHPSRCFRNTSLLNYLVKLNKLDKIFPHPHSYLRDVSAIVLRVKLVTT